MNLALANLCVKAAQRSYDVATISIGETQVLIDDSSGEYLVVAFRGTESIRDCLTDLRVKKEKFYDMLVHSGFLHAYRKVNRKLIDELPSNKNILITGHSLGGALATLFAYETKKFGLKIAGTYTFGCPRVFSTTSAQKFDKMVGKDNLWRIINDADIVCRVPSPLRWKHVGQPLFFDDNGMVHVGPPPWWWAAREAMNDLRALKLPSDIEDHFIKNYVDIMAKSLAR